MGFMMEMECRWFATTAITCWPGKDPDPAKRGDLLPSKDQMAACAPQSQSFLFQKYKPKVIICLGKEAMQAVLGINAPKSVSAIGTTPFRIPNTDTVVFTLEHPSKHYPSARKNPRDLWPDYKAVFETAEQICLNGIPEFVLNWREVSDPGEAMRIAMSMPTEFSFDVEDTHHKKDPERTTVYHPKSEMICMGLGWDNPDGSLEVVVLTGAAMRDKRVLEAIFTDRIAGAYNSHYDITATRELLDFDVLKYVRRVTITWNGVDIEVPGIKDPCVEIYISNQGNIAKGIVKVACPRLVSLDWKQPQHRAMNEANAKIAENNKKIAALKKEMIAFDKYNEQLGSDDKRKVTTAKAWFKKHPDKPNIDLLPQPRPLGSANFGDVEASITYPYCAMDVAMERQVSNVIIPEMQAGPDAYSPLAYALMLRTIELCCYIEENGVSVDPERVEAAIQVVDRLTERAKLALLKQPEVRRALANLPKLRKDSQRPNFILTTDNILNYLAPSASAFKIELAKQTGHQYDLLKSKKTKAPSCPKELVRQFAGAGKVNKRKLFKAGTWKLEWAKLDRNEKIWRVVQDLLDAGNIKSKFLIGLQKFGVDGRVHCDFKVIRAEASSVDEQDGGSKNGRLACADPNLQQTKNDDSLLSLFRADPGKIFVSADFCRGEPVVSAVIMNIKYWLELFSRPDAPDVYQAMANSLYGLGVDIDDPNIDVNAELERVCPHDSAMRKDLKTRTLAMFYGESVFSFTKKAGITLEEGKIFYNKFGLLCPEVGEFIQETQRKILAEEAITTPFGLRMKYQIPFTDSSYEYNLAATVRTATNLPPQATLSNICVWQAWRLMRILQTTELGKHCKLILLVHDSIKAECDKEHAREFAQLLVSTMQDTSALPFPFPPILKATAKVGYSWDKMTKDLDNFKLFRKKSRRPT